MRFHARYEFDLRPAFPAYKGQEIVVRTLPDAGSRLRGALYSPCMTGRVGAKGQVVIPKKLRDRVRLQPGDEVDFELRDEEIVLISRRAPTELGGSFPKTGMAARLLEDRAREPR